MVVPSCLSKVYSPVTDKSYRMQCKAQGNSAVICTGTGARVLLNGQGPPLRDRMYRALRPRGDVTRSLA